MVLQDVSSSPTESLTDEPYPSDNDPYSTSTAPGDLRLEIYFDQLPRPIPILAPVLGYSNKAFRETTVGYLQTAMAIAQQKLTQDEGMAMAYHIAKKQQIASYGAAAGLFAGVFRWYRGNDTFRFPFYTPNPEKFDPYKFWKFKGPQAKAMWNGTRLLAFTILGKFLGELFAANYATASAAVNVQRDPRLADFNAVLKDKIKEAQARRREQAGHESQPGRHIPAPTLSTDNKSAGEDDMSPSAGNEAWSDQDAYGSSGFGSETQERGVEVRPRISPYNNRSDVTSKSSSYDDDASPTGGMFAAEAQNEKSSGGSAWDRIRKDAATGKVPQGQPSTPKSWSTPAQKEQKEGSTLGDSFSFSSTDEERQLAKSEAQREFDERIERERSGGDFNDGRKKW